jgi:hypothetical protein
LIPQDRHGKSAVEVSLTRWALRLGQTGLMKKDQRINEIKSKFAKKVNPKKETFD